MAEKRHEVGLENEFAKELAILNGSTRAWLLRKRDYFSAIISSDWRLAFPTVLCSENGDGFVRDAEYCFRTQDADGWMEGGILTLWERRLSGSCVTESRPRGGTLAVGAGDGESCGRESDSHEKWGRYAWAH